MVSCFVIVHDLTTKMRLCDAKHSEVDCRLEDDGRSPFLHIHNRTDSHTPFQKYSLSNLNGIWIRQKWFALRFRQPRHQMFVQADDPETTQEFCRSMCMLMERYDVDFDLDENYDPRMSQYISPLLCIRQGNDYSHLTQIIVENCNIPKLIVGSGQITHISLSRSTLGLTKLDNEYFFDWMTSKKVFGSLKVLEMDHCKLDRLPYEIMYLTKLHTLSVAHNNLTFLPPYLGKLEKLKNLFVNNNGLKFFPGSLKNVRFKNYNVANNEFKNFRNQNREKFDPIFFKLRQIINPGCMSLSTLAFHSLFNHCVTSKHLLPRSMWHLFDKYVQCKFCNQFVLSDSCYESYNMHYAKTINLCENDEIPWQFYECKHVCNENKQQLELTMASEDVPYRSLRSRILHAHMTAIQRNA